MKSRQNIIGKISISIAAMAILLATSGCTKLRARDQLNKGVQAYKASKFETAIEKFKTAIELDPGLDVAKLYLATACVAQYVPGGDNPENVRMADCAIDQYKKVLDTDAPKATQVLSTKGLASLYFNMKKFDDAKTFDKKAIALDPNDPENYYSVAVIDWTQSYVPRMEARQKLGLKTEDPIKDKKVCEDLKAKNQANVDEGVQMLEKAITLRKDYDDAMAYLNLLYRERADLHCGDPEGRAADIKLADEMVEKTMATKKMKAEKANEQHGIVLDQPNKE
ncbi:MAG: repeat protein [Candidatus Angelobacter sp.]|jgi:tetratricopeptide (TPR) repeat protein|nr:repeat protein [Candidatus Angelobacter sp.]